MRMTHRFAKCMSQRGLGREIVELVVDRGVQEGAEVVRGRRDAAKVMQKLRVLQRIQDKGGLVVVETGEFLITTYNLPHPRY